MVESVRTVLDEIQSYAADDGYFIDSHGTKQFLDGNNFVGHFRGSVEHIAILDIDNFGF